MDLDLVECQAIGGAEMCRSLLNERVKFNGHGTGLELLLREEGLCGGEAKPGGRLQPVCQQPSVPTRAKGSGAAEMT